ncbi:Bacteriophage/Gene transfer agent portal protein [uncultured Caudovirales phage]|uniref:Bacteriophage/Gene transfer agent portal protein n=1 Tax=uncultured Caudovirales phage TaxID=2100421 RepID=A0A6J7WW46_9CAUD|nr:Bacteriophage/Gene transfer agent portal protein [uncultured Caudovirales phage]
MTTKRKKKINSKKPTAKKPNLRFSFEAGAQEQGEKVSPQTLAEGLKKTLGLEKSVKALDLSQEVKESIGESRVAFGSRFNRNSVDNVETKGYQRLSDAELKQLVQLDPYVSAIVATRCSQAAACGNPSESKFKKGLRIIEMNRLERSSFGSDAEYHSELLARTSKMKAIESWILNCGTDSREILDTSFASADRTFKYCNLRQFIEAQARNLLTFGRLATQVMRDSNGTPVMFRPVPIETIAPVIDREDISISRRDESARSSIIDADEYNALSENLRPAAWVQRIDGQNINFFTEDDLKVAYYQKQALFELNGYPLAPLEMAVFMVFIHQQTLGYLKNQFVKGMATKGLISLESTNENVQLSDSDVEDFKQQFHNFVTRTDNSAVTPVIAGPVSVRYVPLSNNPKDMEFLQTEEHVIRALCSAFQISPQEMGYGHLSLPQGGLTQSSKQEDLIRGEERGLRGLLDIIFDQINEIVFENFPEAKGMFKVGYVGVGEDTRDAVVQRQTVEINTTATMASLFADSEKKETIPLGGNVPLAPIFHSNIVRYMKYWELRHFYFGDEEAKDNPAYDFIIDVNLNQAYMQLKTTPLAMQIEEAKLGLVNQEAQAKQLQQQTEMMAAQAQAAQAQEQQQAEAQPQEQEGQPAAQPEEAAEKSVKGPTLRERYLNKSEELKKSETEISSYFREWLKANDYNIA